MKALASRQCGPGSIPGLGINMWVEFVVGSHPCSERFLSGYSSFPLSSKANISKFQFDLDYCQALYHEPIAREIAQALPVLLAFKKLLFFHICDVIFRRSEYRMTSFCTSTFRTSDPTQVYSLSLDRGMLNIMVVYHLSPKSGNFG